MKDARTRRRGSSDPFASDNSPEAVSDRGYGTVKFDGERQTVTARPISIFDIYPDPTQPRRVIPSVVKTAWEDDLRAGNIVKEDLYTTLFRIWLEHIAEEREANRLSALESSLRTYFEGDSEFYATEQLGSTPLEGALFEIISLAINIQRDGLTNPITTARTEYGFQLETGERRWLAFHALFIYTGDVQWSRIPARLVETHNVWRQAAENTQRNDLNAISKARQLAILLMDLLMNAGEEFEPFDSFTSERDFYAQVADGERYRIPRGKSEQLLNAMGLKHPDQLRQYRALLRLPDTFWIYADDNDLTEFEIRQAEKRGYTVTGVTVNPPTPPDVDVIEAENYAQTAKKLAKFMSGVGGFRNETEALKAIKEQYEWLAECEQRIRLR